MNKLTKLLLPILAILFLAACNDSETNEKTSDNSKPTNQVEQNEQVAYPITVECQHKMIQTL